MKYRIRREGNGFRAEIGKPLKFGNIQWTAIENDNDSLVSHTVIFPDTNAAEAACREHHRFMHYDADEEGVVKTFDL